jgi:hypothetical protein
MNIARWIVWLALVLPIVAMAQPSMDQRTQAMAQILNDARQQGRGVVDVLFRGTPSEALTAAIADNFGIRTIETVVGASLDSIAILSCGYRSSEYTKRLLAQNSSRFAALAERSNDPSTKAQKILAGAVGGKTYVTLPACIRLPATRTHVMQSGQDARSLAKTYLGQENADFAFCNMLLALNRSDICKESETPGSLLPGRKIVVLDTPKDQLASRTPLKFGGDTDTGALVSSLRSLDGALDIAKAAEVQIITPASTATCSGPAPAPFDAGAVRDTLLRPILGEKQYLRPARSQVQGPATHGRCGRYGTLPIVRVAPWHYLAQGRCSHNGKGDGESQVRRLGPGYWQQRRTDRRGRLRRSRYSCIRPGSWRSRLPSVACRP